MNRKRQEGIEPLGPLPGEEICFDCPLDDCHDTSQACPLQRRRQEWREYLQDQLQAALNQDGTLQMIIPNSRYQQSIAAAARKLLPQGVRIHSELRTQGPHFVLQVQLERT